MSISQRTVFYGDVNGTGLKRFIDWALVKTTLGMMIEPYVANNRLAMNGSANTTDYDPSDMMARIDSVEMVDLNKYNTMLSFGEPRPLHGGDVLTHVGK